MRKFIKLVAGSVLIWQAEAVELNAEDTNTVERIRSLERRIDELEHKLNEYESKQLLAPTNQSASATSVAGQLHEQTEGASEVRPAHAPEIILGENGFILSSANSNFVVQFGGVLQADSRTFFNDSGIAGNDGFLLRRARPTLQGTVFRDFDFLFVPDFGTGNNGGNNGSAPSPQIYDAYLNYRYSQFLQFQAGKFKSPIGLEQLMADRDLLFNERSLATDLVPTRDFGFELHGDTLRGAIGYAAGVFSGVGDARNFSLSDFQDNKAFEGRLFFQPFKPVKDSPFARLGFGVGGSYQAMQGTNTTGLPNTAGGTLPGYATVGQEQFFAFNPTNHAVVLATGEHWRISPQASYFYGPLGFLGEYVVSDQQVTRTGAAGQPPARLANTGWNVSGSWVLTGETANFTGGVVPRRPFNPHQGHWGALQLVARYSELDIDRDAFPLFADPATSAHSAHEWAAGLNWYLNRNVKVSASFSHTIFGGAGAKGTVAPATVTQKPENVLFTRVQLAF